MLTSALVAMAVLAAGTGGPVPTDRLVDWSLSGVGPAGRSLIVQPGSVGGCDQGDPKVSVIEGPARIVVSVTIKSVQGPEVLCPAIARLVGPQTVRLSSPVAGRAISGDGRHDGPGAALTHVRPDAPKPRVPRVTGLAAADARAALCTWRIRATQSRGDGQVVAQRPAPGASYRVPSAGPPSRCADLPARPVAHLTLR